MKTTLIKHFALFHLFCLSKSLNGQSAISPASLQLLGGVSYYKNNGKTVFPANLGFRFMPERTIFTLSFQYLGHSHNKQYTWPEVGDYRYIRSVNSYNFGLGLTAWRKRRISATFAINADITFSSGKLKSKNSQINHYIVGYKSSVYLGIGPEAMITYKYNRHIFIYADTRLIHIGRRYNPLLCGLGLIYNFNLIKK